MSKHWNLLIDKNMNKIQLKEAGNVSSKVIAKMGRDEPIAVESLVKIYLELGVDIGDVISLNKGKVENK